jgi:hypothetical protein
LLTRLPLVTPHTTRQFVDAATGDFNIGQMEEAFAMVTSPILANTTLKIKGWPGPIVTQADHYPASMPQPSTLADKQRIAGERFNSELALFLLVANEQDFWTYSWFWGWYDYVPFGPSSTVPVEFYPQAKCPLGAPLGLMSKDGKGLYSRQFAHASVSVNLNDRTASKVDFKGCAF